MHKRFFEYFRDDSGSGCEAAKSAWGAGFVKHRRARAGPIRRMARRDMIPIRATDGAAMANLAFPTLCTILVAVVFLALERLRPGRELPHAPGWYARAILINLAQAIITFGTNR